MVDLKYSQLFALHGISIDMLPLLTESQLMEMGVLDSSDRRRILSVMSRIKEFVPAPGRLTFTFFRCKTLLT